MRARNLKPGFFKNEDLASLPTEARLLYAGLWCLADRIGRLEDRPLRIKAEIFPYEHDAEHVLGWCKQLEEKGFILRYEVDGKRYIQVINFLKHQNPHTREQASTCPGPAKAMPRTCLGNAKAMPGPAESLSSDSPSLNPESLSPASPLAGVFDGLWREYPKRLGKKEAERHFNASVKSAVDVQNIRKALANYRRHVDGREKQYVQNGSTWFNNWQDWTDFEEGSNGTHDSKSPVSYAAIARAAREAEKVRKDASTGAVSDGVRNLPDVPDETVPGVGGGHSASG